MVRIASILQQRASASEEGAPFPFLSFEFFPPRTPDGVKKLYERLELMKAYNPCFVDITWGAGGSTAELTLELTIAAKQKLHLNVQMHLTCTNMPAEQVHDALRRAKEAGIKNIVALRGDPPKGEEEWKATEGGFTSALDLVRFIRETYGSHFSIAVAGYPEGHPNAITQLKTMDGLSESEKKRCATIKGENGEVLGYSVCKDEDYESELEYLKKKVDAGADLIFTQMFFDADCYTYFVERCRAKGITVPIIPGIMCINSVGGLKRMVGLCKTRVPEELWTQVDATDAADEDACRQLGISFGKQLCRRLLDYGVPGLHFYCLNHEKVPLGIIDGLGLGPEAMGLESEQLPREEKKDHEETIAPRTAPEAAVPQRGIKVSMNNNGVGEQLAA